MRNLIVVMLLMLINSISFSANVETNQLPEPKEQDTLYCCEVVSSDCDIGDSLALSNNHINAYSCLIRLPMRDGNTQTGKQIKPYLGMYLKKAGTEVYNNQYLMLNNTNGRTHSLIATNRIRCDTDSIIVTMQDKKK